jgi:hypothetical protein
MPKANASPATAPARMDARPEMCATNVIVNAEPVLVLTATSVLTVSATPIELTRLARLAAVSARKTGADQIVCASHRRDQATASGSTQQRMYVCGARMGSIT